jgi:predicted enzyme related to lactoylglutathione lyase
MKLGYTLLYVDDVEKTMSFYENAFGMEKGFLHESNQYGEMLTGDTKLGFVHHQTAGSHGFDYERASLKKPAFGFEIGLVSNNVQESFATAISAGAIEVSKPETKPWGQVVSYVRDCNGFLVEICSPMG